MKMSRHTIQVKGSKQTGKPKVKFNIPIQGIVDKFHRTVSKGPCHTCVSCSQVWYRHSVVKATSLSVSNVSVSNVSEKVGDVFKKYVSSVKAKKYVCLRLHEKNRDGR